MPDALTIVKSEPLTITSSVPDGNERTRRDTNILGVDHDALSLSIANWASKLDPKWQKPAAMLATFPADVLASLAEMFSSPETVASAPGALKAVDAVGTAATAAAKGVPKAAINATAAMGDAIHPDVIGVISPRAGRVVELAQRLRDKFSMPPAKASLPPRLAGKAPALENVLTDAVNEVRTASPSSVSLPGGNTWRAEGAVPTAAPARPAAPAAPSAAPPAPAPRAPVRPAAPPAAPPIQLTAEEADAVQALVKEGYPEDDVVRELLKQRPAQPPPPTPAAPATTPDTAPISAGWGAAESKEYVRLRNAGKSDREARELIRGQLAMRQRFALPTAEQVQNAVTERNESGRW